MLDDEPDEVLDDELELEESLDDDGVDADALAVDESDDPVDDAPEELEEPRLSVL